VKKLLLLILPLLSYYIYAEDTFRFNFNIAVAGFGVNYSSETDYNIELFVEFLPVRAEHKDTNIGIGLTPVKYWIFSFSDELNLDNDRQKWSFLNFNVNWNILDNKKVFLGPFCSINYFFSENAKMKWNEYVFTGGMRFFLSFYMFNNDIFSHFLSSEIGYRNINGVNKFHFNINIDLLTLIYIVGYGEYYVRGNRQYNKNL